MVATRLETSRRAERSEGLGGPWDTHDPPLADPRGRPAVPTPSGLWLRNGADRASPWRFAPQVGWGDHEAGERHDAVTGGRVATQRRRPGLDDFAATCPRRSHGGARTPRTQRNLALELMVAPLVIVEQLPVGTTAVEITGASDFSWHDLVAIGEQRNACSATSGVVTAPLCERESSISAWCGVRGIDECRCEREPQFPFSSGPSPGFWSRVETYP